jgi:cytoskeletal protein RodZ
LALFVHLILRVAITTFFGGFAMKNFMIRLSLAVVLTLSLMALAQSSQAQEPSSQAPATTTPPDQQSPSAQDQQTPPATPPDSTHDSPSAQQQQNEPQMPAAGADAQTQEAQAFTGRIMKENGKVVLKDPVTKNSYQVDDVSKANPFIGKQVKVTGKLDINSNTITIATIEPIS